MWIAYRAIAAAEFKDKPLIPDSSCHNIGMALIAFGMLLAVGAVANAIESNMPGVFLAGGVTVAGLPIIFIGIPALMAIVRNTRRSAELLEEIRAKVNAQPDALERVP